MKTGYIISAILLALLSHSPSSANFISADSSNYTSFLGTLVPGDTLHLAAGTYTHNLTLNGRNGTPTQPIVIMGDANLFSTIFQAQSCCNTVSITQCSYLVIKNLKLDGMNVDVDAVKGEGTSGNWAHHIILEYLDIVNYGNDQQDVGISTKCHAWNWLIRKNIIVGAGTGMYLGNSDGDKPFVNGVIEYNLIMNTVGYNIEIKHQLDGVRDAFPGTAVDGKTIIRHNVFCKESNASTDANARPNLLVGAFPSTGWGAKDYYEIYGNFFYQNPVEALFQGNGNIALYENVFVNHFDPDGSRAVYITDQNGFQPRDIRIFHNTVWAANSSGGIRLFNPNTNYQQYCYANAVFALSPITNFTNSIDNITDTYLNASHYVLSATTNLDALNLYPQSGQLTGTSTSSTLFQPYVDWNIDFNGDAYDWTFRGAYSGCCANNGWQLQLDTMPTVTGTLSSVDNLDEHHFDVVIVPNPVTNQFTIQSNQGSIDDVEIYDILGQNVYNQRSETGNQQQVTVNVAELHPGVYLLRINSGSKDYTRKLVVR